MTVANSEYKVTYSGGGATGTIYHIPFSWDTAATLKVRVISSIGTVSAKTEGSSNDYSLTGVLSNSTQTVYTHAAADYGWIKWNAAATASNDTIEIYREEPATVSTNYANTGSFGTVTEFERDADRIVMAMSRTCNRSEEDPLVYDAKMRYIKDLGNASRGDDGLNDTLLNTISAVTPALSVPNGTGLNQYLSPSGYAAGSDSGAVTWGSITEIPSTSGVNTRYALVSSSSTAYSWAELKWIPPAPDDGNGYFLSINQAGTLSWAKVYEIPMSDSGSDNDVVALTAGRVIGWRTLSESPYASTTNAKTKRFVTYNGSALAWGPRHTYGTHTISSVTVAEDSSVPVGNGVHSANSIKTFQFNHNMKNDSDADIAPDRVFLTVETEKLDGSAIGGTGDDAIPVYAVMLDNESDSPAGITSTQINGKVQYINCNDDLSDTGGHENTLSSGKLNLVIAAGQNHAIKIHWLAIKD